MPFIDQSHTVSNLLHYSYSVIVFSPVHVLYFGTKIARSRATL